jgi:hypothetical protein
MRWAIMVLYKNSGETMFAEGQHHFVWRITTWATTGTEDEAKVKALDHKGKNSRSWVAPFDETRFTVPEDVRNSIGSGVIR